VHQHLRLTLEDEQIVAIAHFKDFLLEWGFIPADFDVARWIDGRALEAATRRLAA
jgi:ABC-type nitrate/sulfonate/bicarbonate transport system substrate-binding protein